MTARSQQLFGTDSPVAFVTGSAADRVGRRIAETLQENGYRVAFHSHREGRDSKRYVDSRVTTGHEAMLCTGAIETEGNPKLWLDQILSRWGRIDVVVNSAAIWDPKGLEDISASDLYRNLQVNAIGSFLVIQQFGLAMVAQPHGGAIVQIGDWAVTRPYTDFAAYFLGKGTVETMTRSLAIELATRNSRIRVNAVLPGPVMLASEVSEEKEKAIVQQCLLHRAGTAQDVADAVYFLATSPFITGVCLPVDGGRTIYAGPGTDRYAHPKVGNDNPI